MHSDEYEQARAVLAAIHGPKNNRQPMNYLGDVVEVCISDRQPIAYAVDVYLIVIGHAPKVAR